MNPTVTVSPTKFMLAKTPRPHPISDAIDNALRHKFVNAIRVRSIWAHPAVIAELSKEVLARDTPIVDAPVAAGFRVTKWVDKNTGHAVPLVDDNHAALDIVIVHTDLGVHHQQFYRSTEEAPMPTLLPLKHPTKGHVRFWLAESHPGYFTSRAGAAAICRVRGTRVFEWDDNGNVWDGNTRYGWRSLDELDPLHRYPQTNHNPYTEPFTIDQLTQLVNQFKPAPPKEDPYMTAIKNSPEATATTKLQYGLQRPDGTIEWDTVTDGENTVSLEGLATDPHSYARRSTLARVIHARSTRAGIPHNEGEGYRIVARLVLTTVLAHTTAIEETAIGLGGHLRTLDQTQKNTAA